MVPLDKKAIQKNLGTCRHNQTHPWIIQAYLNILITLCYPDIFETVVYPEPWHIQNQKHIQNPGLFTTLVYSEPSYIQNAGGIFKIWGIFRTLSRICNEYFHDYHYFHKYWNKYIEVVSPEVVVLCKLRRVRWMGTVNFWYTYWYLQIN